jgi:hypothetical protein
MSASGAVFNQPVRTPPTRTGTGRVIYVEDFRTPLVGLWNDSVGLAYGDCDILFNGLPTLRLDTAAQANAGATNPGRTVATTGVVTKRRIHDGFRHKFGLEFWFRMTSLNLTTNTFVSASIYNRDGTNAYHGRVWLDPNGNNQPMVARILDGAATGAASGTNPASAATYTAVVTSVLQNGGGTHLYDAPTGRLDRAGGWHYCKLVVDMVNKTYVSIQLDGEAVTDLSAYQLDTTTSSGFAGMHHSFELSSTTTTRRYINIAHVVGTVED